MKLTNSLRNNPVCPFGNLEWKGYYWKYPRKKIGYEEEYWGVVLDPDGKERNLVGEWEDEARRTKYLLDVIKILKPGRLLDVGCGPGFFLSTVGDEWDKYGIDISKKALEYCSKYAKTIHTNFLDAFEENKFDVVVMNHVIEHLEKPVKYIEEAKKILVNDGILMIATPDFDSACARHFGLNFRMLSDKGHISLFTSASLIKLLEDKGFEMIHVRYPFFETEYFNKENLDRLFDTTKVSPPFYGNHMVAYARCKK